MRTIWTRFEQAVEKINRIGAVLAEIALMLLLLLVFHEVISRYLLDKPTTYSVELSEYLLIFVAFIAAGWVMLQDKHVRMQSFIGLMPARVRNIFLCITSAVVLLFCGILVWQGTKSAIMAFKGGYHSSSLLNTPMWIPYSIIPLGSFLLALAVIVKIRTYFLAAFTKQKEI